MALMTVKVLVDKASVDQVKRQVGQAAEQEARKALPEMAREGVEFLRRLELGRGHEFMATLWTHTPIMETANGGLMLEIYSRGEEMTFYAPGGKDRRPDPRYPIAGKNLLMILEGGAKAHAIEPRGDYSIILGEYRGSSFAGGSRLAFPAPDSGEPTSDFGGVFEYEGGIAEQSFRSLGPFHTIRPMRVQHPGFPGNDFVSQTRSMLEAGIEANGEKIAQRIAARLR